MPVDQAALFKAPQVPPLGRRARGAAQATQRGLEEPISFATLAPPSPRSRARARITRCAFDDLTEQRWPALSSAGDSVRHRITACVVRGRNDNEVETTMAKPTGRLAPPLRRGVAKRL